MTNGRAAGWLNMLNGIRNIFDQQIFQISFKSWVFLVETSLALFAATILKRRNSMWWRKKPL